MKVKAYKFRFYPSKLQEKEMNTHLWLSKELWNEMLAFTKFIYKNYQKFPTKRALREFVKNSGLYSQVGQELVERIITALKRKINMKKKGMKCGFPRFKSLDRMKSLFYPQYENGFWLDKKLKVTPFGELSIKKHREIKGKIKTLTLKRESSGKWFATFSVEQEKKQSRENNGEQLGIDLGLMKFATLSNGSIIKNPIHLKKHEERLVFFQRRLSKKKKRSKYCKAGNRSKARIKVAIQYEKVKNSRKDFLHKLSTKLVNNYSFIVLEKLSSKEMSMRRRHMTQTCRRNDMLMAQQQLGKSINDAGWNMFANMLSYKAEEAGSRIIFVNPKNTTKECNRCGCIVEKSLKDRIHSCPNCGLSIDRDLNASINILKRATEGTSGSNACGNGTIVPSVKQEASPFRVG